MNLQIIHISIGVLLFGIASLYVDGAIYMRWFSTISNLISAIFCMRYRWNGDYLNWCARAHAHMRSQLMQMLHEIEERQNKKKKLSLNLCRTWIHVHTKIYQNKHTNQGECEFMDRIWLNNLIFIARHFFFFHRFSLISHFFPSLSLFSFVCFVFISSFICCWNRAPNPNSDATHWYRPTVKSILHWNCIKYQN